MQVSYKRKQPPHFEILHVFHMGQLKPFDTNGSYHPPPPAMMVEGEGEFEVEEILTHKPKGRRKIDPKVKFLIQWQGYNMRAIRGSHTIISTMLLLRYKSIGTELQCQQKRIRLLWLHGPC